METLPPDLQSPDKLNEAERLLAHFEQLEEQFQKLRQALTHSHRLATLGTLASVIAHEYNNILTPVISYAQLALARPDDTQLLIKAVEKALQGAQRATQVSSSLLGFARDGDQQTTAHLPTVVQETVACMGRDPKKDGIDLILSIPDIRVKIAPVSLQQVLLNLLLNARQAMRKRGGQLRVTARVDNDNLARIDVADTGPGIPEAVREHLFEPFVTLRPDGDTSESKGTGLGLAICKDLITNAGGSITYTTKTNIGTTFTLYVPMTEPCFEST